MAKARIKIDVEGIDNILNQFSRFDQESRVNLRKAVRSNANALRKAIQSRAPVDSGNLKSSIKAKYEKDGFGADVGPVSGKGSHAHLIEFGTVKMSAQPFITPSAEEQKPKYEKDIKGAIKGAIP